MPRDITFYKRQLEEKKLEISTLRQVSEMVHSAWNLSKILKHVINVMHDYTRSNSCFVYLLDCIGGQRLTLEASQNPHPAALGKVQMTLSEGVTGWVAKHQKTVHIPVRAYDDSRFKYFNALPEDKYEAFLSLPIILKDKVIGVINIQHKRKKQYQKSQIAFLETLTHLLAGAIENARLVDETNILKQALETRKVVEKAKGLLMKQRAITESEAHQLLNKKSMDTRKSLGEIAEAIIISSEITI